MKNNNLIVYIIRFTGRVICLVASINRYIEKEKSKEIGKISNYFT